MRSIALAAGLLLCPIALIGCGEGPPTTTVIATPVVLRYDVQGMHCEGCVAAIQTKVLRVEGVSACEVSLDQHEATITIADPALVAERTQAVEAAIKALNYTITPKPPAG